MPGFFWFLLIRLMKQRQIICNTQPFATNMQKNINIKTTKKTQQNTTKTQPSSMLFSQVASQKGGQSFFHLCSFATPGLPQTHPTPRFISSHPFVANPPAVNQPTSLNDALKGAKMMSTSEKIEIFLQNQEILRTKCYLYVSLFAWENVPLPTCKLLLHLLGKIVMLSKNCFQHIFFRTSCWHLTYRNLQFTKIQQMHLLKNPIFSYLP